MSAKTSEIPFNQMTFRIPSGRVHMITPGVLTKADFRILETYLWGLKKSFQIRWENDPWIEMVNEYFPPTQERGTEQ